MKLEINKCGLNELSDVRLSNIFLKGDGPLNKDVEVQSTDVNNCRGVMSYADGPQYVFNLIGYTDCNTQVDSSDDKTTYTNSVQGFPTAKVSYLKTLS